MTTCSLNIDGFSCWINSFSAYFLYWKRDVLLILNWYLCDLSPLFMRIQYYANILHDFCKTLPILIKSFCEVLWGSMLVLHWFHSALWGSALGLWGFVQHCEKPCWFCDHYPRYFEGLQWFHEVLWWFHNVLWGIVRFHNGSVRFRQALLGSTMVLQWFYNGYLSLWGSPLVPLVPQNFVKFWVCSIRLSDCELVSFWNYLSMKVVLIFIHLW